VRASSILEAVAAAGIHVMVDGDELVLEASHTPSLALIDAMRSHKAEIVALIRAGGEHPSSSALLRRLGVEVVLIEDEETAEREISALVAQSEVIGLDIETAARPEHSNNVEAALDPLKAEIRLLQLASETKALVIDLRRVLLSSPSLRAGWGRTLVGHNLSFDLKMLAAGGVDLGAATIIDTILLSGLFLRGEDDRSRQGSRRPSLAVAAKEALGVELPKDLQTSDWSNDVLSDEQIAYAALDAVIARRLLSHFGPDVEAQRLAADGLTLADRLNRAVLPIARMELAGVQLDAGALAKLDADWNTRAGRLREEIRDIFGVENPSSAPQLAAWLTPELHRLGLHGRWPRTSAGQLSTRAKHLKRLIGLVQGVELFIELSAVQQLASKFGQKLLNRVATDGRLRANFQIAGAKSGRFTSSRPNLQNIPRAREVRSAFVAARGCSLVCADYSQLELRVMAAIAGDPVMTEAYREGRDLHSITAAGMLGVDPEEFDRANPTHAEARKKAKAINFGIIFGCGAEGLQEFARDAYDVTLSVKEAAEMIRRFLTTYRGVARWMER
jgi:DNA polymerase I